MKVECRRGDLFRVVDHKEGDHVAALCHYVLCVYFSVCTEDEASVLVIASHYLGKVEGWCDDACCTMWYYYYYHRYHVVMGYRAVYYVGVRDVGDVGYHCPSRLFWYLMD